ncbi:MULTISPECIES: manganese efflux pump MntP [Paenibacillus]|jgi:manganese efflux pump family protein|uniref:manganese efflux pump MntP n=1 Tax=Paenibacillus TaxID=44249 RepID=UPI00073EC665|nr:MULTISPECIES: manganese efflux pump MntP family protein [Paenibacillus]MDU4695054.1 manganese efflux pump MntP family protein [Paenibacillus sp.]
MTEAYERLGELLTILLMAAALGMDALSLGVGIGMKGVRRKDALRIGTMVALFHVLMPLLGIAAGQYVGALLGSLARYAAGGLLFLLGAHMIISSVKGSGVHSINHRTWFGVLLFSLSVSIDSFSVGVSLGMFHGDWLLTVLAFGFFGGIMSLVGLAMGRGMGRSLGDYGEAAGGAILLAFGLLFIF